MIDDQWAMVASSNDAVVAELLLQLKKWPADSSGACILAPVLPPARWGSHRRRSRPAADSRKDRCAARCSPTTPLSWTSTSDGCEASDLSCDDRSKFAIATGNEVAAINSVSGKRKTLVKLLEEEGVVLSERAHLKEELTSVSATLVEQMATSENLKRIKINLLQRGNHISESSDKSTVGSSYPCSCTESTAVGSVPLVPQAHAICGSEALSDLCPNSEKVEAQEKGFILPDLNMTASEEDAAEVLYTAS